MQNEEGNIMYVSALLNAVQRAIEFRATALQTNFTEITDRLRNGDDINTIDEVSGDTALHLAARANYYELVEWLLDRGANHSIRNRNHAKPKKEAILRNDQNSWETVEKIENKVGQIKRDRVVTGETTLQDNINTLQQYANRIKEAHNALLSCVWEQEMSPNRELRGQDLFNLLNGRPFTDFNGNPQPGRGDCRIYP